MRHPAKNRPCHSKHAALQLKIGVLHIHYELEVLNTRRYAAVKSAYGLPSGEALRLPGDADQPVSHKPASSVHVWGGTLNKSIASYKVLLLMLVPVR